MSTSVWGDRAVLLTEVHHGPSRRVAGGDVEGDDVGTKADNRATAPAASCRVRRIASSDPVQLQGRVRASGLLANGEIAEVVGLRQPGSRADPEPISGCVLLPRQRKAAAVAAQHFPA
jgi:hypothetical protein